MTRSPSVTVTRFCPPGDLTTQIVLPAVSTTAVSLNIGVGVRVGLAVEVGVADGVFVGCTRVGEGVDVERPGDSLSPLSPARGLTFNSDRGRSVLLQ